MSPRRQLNPGLLLAGFCLCTHALLGADGASPLVATDTGGSKPTVRSTGTPAPVAFDAFRLLVERNIFNPKRVGRSLPTVESPRDEVISLVGTMNSDRGLVAFFDGSDASFRRTLVVGGSIDQYTVTLVDQSGVELALKDIRLALKVGQQLRRPPGGDWKTQEIPVALAAPAANDTAVTTPAIPADASETLRRLMEKRQKQLNP